MKREDVDEFWAMPFGDSIYTHGPDAPSLSVGTAYQKYFKPGKGRGRKVRRIGFRPPKSRRHDGTK